MRGDFFFNATENRDVLRHKYKKKYFKNYIHLKPFLSDFQDIMTTLLSKNVAKTLFDFVAIFCKHNIYFKIYI